MFFVAQCSPFARFIAGKICPVCQLRPPAKKRLPEGKVEKVEYKMPTCVNILQLELSAVLPSLAQKNCVVQSGV